MSIDYQLIGQRVREYRCRQHLRQDALAWDAEISVSYLSCIENGVKQASLGSIVRIAEALNVSIERLLFGEIVYEDDVFQELYTVLNGCGETEQAIIMDSMLGTAVAVKRSLRTNGIA